MNGCLGPRLCKNAAHRCSRCVWKAPLWILREGDTYQRNRVDTKSPPSGPYCLHQWDCSQYLYYPLKVITEHLQTHLRSHPPQCSCQEMRCAHPGLQCPEGMLDGLSAYPHFLRIQIQPPLHVIRHVLVFPAPNPPFLARRALGM